MKSLYELIAQTKSLTMAPPAPPALVSEQRLQYSGTRTWSQELKFMTRALPALAVLGPLFGLKKMVKLEGCRGPLHYGVCTESMRWAVNRTLVRIGTLRMLQLA